MFEKILKFYGKYTILNTRNFEQMFLFGAGNGGGYIMNDATKELIIQMVKKLDDSDKKFLRQLYTILRRHLGKGKR